MNPKDVLAELRSILVASPPDKTTISMPIDLPNHIELPPGILDHIDNAIEKLDDMKDTIDGIKELFSQLRIQLDGRILEPQCAQEVELRPETVKAPEPSPPVTAASKVIMVTQTQLPPDRVVQNGLQAPDDNPLAAFAVLAQKGVKS